MEFANPFEAHRNVGVPLQQRSWKDQRFDGEDWAGVTFQDCAFDGASFASVNLLQTMFVDCRFVNCVFEDCNLVGTHLAKCTGTGFVVRGGVCRELALSECEFDTVRLEQTGRQMLLAQSRFGELLFADGGLNQEIPTLSDCEIGALVAPNAFWSDASAVSADLSNWRIDGASFLRCSFIRTVAEGVDLSNVTFVSCNLYQARLAGAVLRSVEKCIFAECELDGANFEEAHAAGSLYANSRAHGCRFDAASMAGALFPETDLTGASFVGANAPGSVWVGAILDDANVERLSAPESTFRNARFTHASVQDSDFRQADLHGVEGDLSAADTRDSRGSVDWRAARERELQRLREGKEED